ncbi:alpha/beta fold hydrolase [Falsibacillus pallidus]|uniref:alpha/beta fold hydrolase n=1 Tax=Falsibacillus pallidus TaxID=493781 RepID=UPI003D98EE23
MKGIDIKTQEFFITVNDAKLYAKVLGTKNNTPTVVMDSGYGDYSKAWNKVAPEIAKLTDVVLYDRAGLGKSEKSNKQRTSEQMVAELKELLLKMNLEPPYMLVGHSFGGVNMRLFAAEYPEDVCGLVLVDSTPEDYKERFLPTMSVEFQEAYNKQFIYEGDYQEFMQSLQQVKQERNELEIPLTVISAGKKAHYSTQSQDLWNDMQQELLDLSSRSDFILAKNSAHYIQNDEPLVVINAIKKVIEINK